MCVCVCALNGGLTEHTKKPSRREALVCCEPDFTEIDTLQISIPVFLLKLLVHLAV